MKEEARSQGGSHTMDTSDKRTVAAMTESHKIYRKRLDKKKRLKAPEKAKKKEELATQVYQTFLLNEDNMTLDNFLQKKKYKDLEETVKTMVEAKKSWDDWEPNINSPLNDKIPEVHEGSDKHVQERTKNEQSMNAQATMRRMAQNQIENPLEEEKKIGEENPEESDNEISSKRIHKNAASILKGTKRIRKNADSIVKGTQGRKQPRNPKKLPKETKVIEENQGGKQHRHPKKKETKVIEEETPFETPFTIPFAMEEEAPFLQRIEEADSMNVIDFDG
jgi:hypothetical protein